LGEAQASPIERMGKAEEVLASDECSFDTGTEFIVERGLAS
jgi:hypothetical protein